MMMVVMMMMAIGIVRTTSVFGRGGGGKTTAWSGGHASRALFLLHGIFFTLPMPTPCAFGGQTFIPKGRPGPKVFTSLAPLDFQIRSVRAAGTSVATVFQYGPDCHIAGGAHPLVLSGNNMYCGGRGIGFVGVVGVVRRRVGGGCRASIHAIGRRRTNAQLTTHDTMTFSLGCQSLVFTRSPCLPSCQMFRKVHQQGKVRQLEIHFFRISAVGKKNSISKNLDDRTLSLVRTTLTQCFWPWWDVPQEYTVPCSQWSLWFFAILRWIS